MRDRAKGARLAVLGALALFMSACSGRGIDAGGETTSENGGVAFIMLTGFLVVGGLILWFILGRED
ncbi:MAG TPA: hypothetical protein VIG64_02410 [Actinomycetota bacterium]|jgi:hypothetical protein